MSKPTIACSSSAPRTVSRALERVQPARHYDRHHAIYGAALAQRPFSCGAIGGMFMTQLVGFVLTRSHNNYTLLFTMIPAAYFVALAWMFVTYPRHSRNSLRSR